MSRLTAGLIGAAVIAAPLLIAAPAIAADPIVVDIRVELDLLDADGNPTDDGPAVFEVTDAVVGDGPELTGANLVSNPSGWCGSLQVEVDGTALSISISPDDECDFTDVWVTVSSDSFSGMSLVSDGLFGNIEGETPRVLLDWTFTANTLAAHWAINRDVESGSVDFTGTTVFSFAPPAPAVAPAPALVPTGSADLGPLLGIGALVLVAGAGLVVAARRRVGTEA